MLSLHLLFQAVVWWIIFWPIRGITTMLEASLAVRPARKQRSLQIAELRSFRVTLNTGTPSSRFGLPTCSQPIQMRCAKPQCQTLISSAFSMPGLAVTQAFQGAEAAFIVTDFTSAKTAEKEFQQGKNAIDAAREVNQHLLPQFPTSSNPSVSLGIGQGCCSDLQSILFCHVIPHVMCKKPFELPRTHPPAPR